jgi:hypothetical protein
MNKNYCSLQLQELYLQLIKVHNKHSNIYLAVQHLLCSLGFIHHALSTENRVLLVLVLNITNTMIKNLE